MKNSKEHVERRLSDVSGRIATSLSLRRVLELILVSTWCVLCNAQADKICLDRVTAKSENSGNMAFDQRYDRTNNGEASFSCDLFVSASMARNALEAFRFGVLYDDKKSIENAFTFPVRVIIGESSNAPKSKTVFVKNYHEWIELKAKEMTKEQLQIVRCSWLGNVTIVGRQSVNPGFIIGDGLAFFSTSAPGDVRVTSIDLMAVSSEMLSRTCSQ